MDEILLATDGLIKRFGGLIATDQVNLEIKAGELHALIGPNGAGKTTIVAQLSGELRPDGGRIRFRGKDITRQPVHARAGLGIARSFQITNIFLGLTVLENVSLCVQACAGHSFRFWAPFRSQSELHDPALELLKQVELADHAGELASKLAHGEKRALEIAMALASRPRLLILDEPMAGMGPDDSARMIKLLLRLKQQFTIFLIEHDMDAVFALADRITVLVYGRTIATGSPAEIRGNPAVREAYLGGEE